MSDDGWNSDPDTNALPIQSTTYRSREFSGNSRPRGNRGGFRGNDRGGFRGSGRGDRNTSGNWRNHNSSDSPTVTLKVPADKVGRIIGRGGAKIRDLESDSQATIKIGEENYGSTEITLIGNDEQTSKARSLIEDLMTESQPYRGSQNRQNGNSYDQAESEYPALDTLGDNGVIDWAALNKAHDDAQAAKYAKLPPIRKDFYQEDPLVSNLTSNEVERIRLANNCITVKRTFDDIPHEGKIPNPVTTFEQAFKNYPEILQEIKKQGFANPSPIQMQAWPVLLSGEDLIGIAQTGTGKTLAFLLPALIHIDNQPQARTEKSDPRVLIMAPTRELALQIETEINKYEYKGIKAVCIYGGADRREQIKLVTKGVDIIIATPGRLNDLVSAGHISVDTFSYIVLDEADRMLDLGFEPQIRKSLFDVRPDRQTVMTSATWPTGVRRLAQTYMRDPIQVNVGSLDLAAVHTVTQNLIFVDEDDKQSMLTDFLKSMDPTDKVIVFCGRKATATHIFTDLCLMGFQIQSIHGDREQSDREQALEEIKDGSVNILIATDVASRGIDINDITHVVNYDFPRNIEEYVHRVGRTGRAGRTGIALSFMTRNDWGNAEELIKIMEEANQEVPLELEQMSKRFAAMKLKREETGGGRGGRGRGGGRGGGRRDRW